MRGAVLGIGRSLARRGFAVSVHAAQRPWNQELARMSVPIAAATPNPAFASIVAMGTAYDTAGNQTTPFGGRKIGKNEIASSLSARSNSRKEIFSGVGAKQVTMHVNPSGGTEIRTRTPGDHAVIPGQVLGLGAGANVSAALDRVKAMHRDGTRHVHLSSWSRGGEMVSRLASEISRDSHLARDITLSACLIDPTPGPFRTHLWGGGLPAICKRVTVLFSSGKAMPGFAALLTNLVRVQNVLITTFPTNHAGVAGIVERTGTANSACARLARDLAEKAYREYGGHLDYSLDLSDVQILNEYASIVRMNSQLGSPSSVRRLINQFNSYAPGATSVSDVRLLQLPDQSDVWVNSHHLLTYKRQYPLTFKTFVAGERVADPDELETEVHKLSRESPMTFGNLGRLLESRLLR